MSESSGKPTGNQSLDEISQARWKEAVLARLEPGVGDCLQTAVYVSTAISLKRLADAVIGTPDKSGIHDTLWDIASRPRGS